MSSQNDHHSLVVDYLLGRLSETELERFERSYLANENLFEELQEVEDELIDDYAAGALSRDQKVAFEKYFLRSSQRREKLAFATSMTERAVAWQKGTVVSPESTDRQPASSELPEESISWLRWLPWKRPVPAWREWAAIAAALLLAIVGGALWLRNRELRQQLVAADANYAKLRQEAAAQSAMTAETKAELSAEQQQSQMLETQVEQLQTSTADEIRNVIINFTLDINHLVLLTRGGEKKVKTLEVPTNARLVRLAVEAGKVPFESFNILLRRGDESVVWRRSGLKAKPAGDRLRLHLAIPAEKLAPGNYELLLMGVPSEGDAESVGRYYLKVERKRATR